MIEKLLTKEHLQAYFALDFMTFVCQNRPLSTKANAGQNARGGDNEINAGNRR